MTDKCFDILVIGGGINGCGIARDAAGRGYSVCLAEMNDLASGTSSWSTKLIHGGLRYLEYFEFRLVREALIEREVLWSIAPHIVRPLRFILPHHKGLRPVWLIRLGLFLYDTLGGRKRLPATKTLNLKTHQTGKSLKSDFRKGFEYSDCWVDDARLVVLNAVDAKAKGAEINVRTKVIKIERSGDYWQAVLRDMRSGTEHNLQAKLIVNAAGPWVDHVLTNTLGSTQDSQIRMVQGSHLVVRKLYEHDRCYIFQNADDRIIFAIPYEEDFTLIGTTDRDYDGDPGAVKITDEEIDYLCSAASEYFVKPITRKDIVWTYSGVRPLYDDGADAAQAATRDYILKLDDNDGPPLINIFGGKITTYRKLAESMMDIVENKISAKGQSWTEDHSLPGGGFAIGTIDSLTEQLKDAHPFLSDKATLRLIRSYGTCALNFLVDLSPDEKDFSGSSGLGLFRTEIDHLIEKEWARTVEDVLWRRSKLGLHLDKEAVDELEIYISEKVK